MIKVIKKNKVIEISGHAGYGEVGKDIVCASVSSVIMTTVNSIMNIDNLSISYVDDKDKIIIEKLNDNDIVDKLLDTMILILKDLEKQYKENIKVESEEGKCYI